MAETITSNPNFGNTTSAEEVAAIFAPRIAGKVILVTGASPGGLGAQFAQVTLPHKPKLDDREFEFAYTTTFRDDASLRSRGEVEVLGSIFGDVDRHLEMHMLMGGRGDSERTRQRAARALEQLRALA